MKVMGHHRTNRTNRRGEDNYGMMPFGREERIESNRDLTGACAVSDVPVPAPV